MKQMKKTYILKMNPMISEEELREQYDCAANEDMLTLALRHIMDNISDWGYDIDDIDIEEYEEEVK